MLYFEDNLVLTYVINLFNDRSDIYDWTRELSSCSDFLMSELLRLHTASSLVIVGCEILTQITVTKSSVPLQQAVSL